jgi:hypothetical protein
MATNTNIVERLAARFATVAVAAAIEPTGYGGDHELIHDLERVIAADLKQYAEQLALLVRLFAHADRRDHA